MKAIDRPLTQLINNNQQFIIPVFQRDYSWTIVQCNDLWKSVLTASESQSFLGSIVYISAGGGAGFGKWLVIDGQQRLTTLTLLLIALRDSIKERNWTGSDESPNVEKIDAYYLKNVFEQGDRQYKLALRRADNATLKTLIDCEDIDELDENRSNRSQQILENYQHFKNLLGSDDWDFDVIYRGIGQLNIVEVTLERNVDNPHLVFESMNSTGVDLSQSDLVRNFLLMRIDESEQAELYDKYWSKVDDYFRASADGFDYFLRDYIALQTKSSQPFRLDQIYTRFKDYWHTRDAGSTTEDELIKIKRIARTYASFLGTKEIQREWLAPAMRSMRSLGTTQGVLVMQLYECHIDENKSLDQEQFVAAIRLIESYILRRAVLGLRTTSYWTLFTRMAFEIDPNESFNSLQVAFATLPHSYSFPTNDEFERALRENNMFLYRICRHLLDGLENYGQREKSPTHDYSIEHIMPQSIKGSEEWQSMLGEDWESVHEQWLHKLGNLTLTAYNSKLSNSPFAIKKTTNGGFDSSAVRLNKFVSNQDTWTEKQIAKRGERLGKWAIEIWPPLNVSDQQIRDAKRAKLIARADKRTWDELEMPNWVRELLESTLQEIREISPIIEVVQSKAGSLYTYWPDCFVELIPYKTFLRLTLPLTYSEIEKLQDLNVRDASRWKFVTSSNHRGEHNVLVDISSPQHIQQSMPLIRNALDQAN